MILTVYFMLCFQSATGRIGAINKMLNNQLCCLFWRQLLQWHNCLEHFSYIRHRQRRKNCYLQLIRQLRTSRMLLRPVQLWNHKAKASKAVWCMLDTCVPPVRPNQLLSWHLGRYVLQSSQRQKAKLWYGNC